MRLSQTPGDIVVSVVTFDQSSPGSKTYAVSKDPAERAWNLSAWRYSGERNSGESIESTTRMFPRWYNPRFRFFSGREDRLPIDGNLLVALMAPRSILVEYGLNDEVSNSWGNEQSYHSALGAYELLGHPERIGILRYPAFTAPTIRRPASTGSISSSAVRLARGRTICFFRGLSINGAKTRRRAWI